MGWRGMAWDGTDGLPYLFSVGLSVCLLLLVPGLLPAAGLGRFDTAGLDWLAGQVDRQTGEASRWKPVYASGGGAVLIKIPGPGG